jgi:hypothetical protein
VDSTNDSWHCELGGAVLLVDAILLARMAKHRALTDVAWAWQTLERTHGAAPIG